MRDTISYGEVSGIMIRLKVVKQEGDYSETESYDESSSLGYGVHYFKGINSTMVRV